MSTVSDALTASWAAHAAWRRTKDRAKLEEARDLRVMADTLDPGHTDEAWDAESIRTPRGRNTHEEMVRFYREKLG